MLQPGDVVVADFPGATGIKTRPAVVVSTVVYQMNRPDIVLGLLTTRVASATAPTDYVLQDWAASALRAQSAFRAYFVMVRQTDVRAKIGALSARDWLEVQARLRIALAVQ
jgi:mRNA interferase MazF